MTIRMHASMWTLNVAVALAFGMAPADAAGRCKPATAVVDVSAALEPPKDVAVKGVKLVLRYPTESVDLPGFGDEPAVKQRLRDLPPEFVFSPNDTDATLVLALAGTRALPSDRILTVRFDRCEGAAPVSAGDFECIVEEAADQDDRLLRSGVGCRLTLSERGT